MAEDLIKVRNITRPDRLAIRGGSNGGLLMGNMIVRRPDLWGAVICQVSAIVRYDGYDTYDKRAHDVYFLSFFL